MDKKSIRDIVNSLNKSDVFTSEYDKERETTTYSYKDYEMVCLSLSYSLVKTSDLFRELTISLIDFLSISVLFYLFNFLIKYLQISNILYPI
jgi:hypothetical protein